MLAGGQNLVPSLNLRLARPAVVIDVDGIEELRGIRAGDGALVLTISAASARAAPSPAPAAVLNAVADALGIAVTTPPRDPTSVLALMDAAVRPPN